MPQTEVIRTEPYIKEYTDQDTRKMIIKYFDLLKNGKTAEAAVLANEIPLPPKTASILKQELGINALIASGANLYSAVKYYGRDFLD